MADEWTTLTDDAEALRTALAATGLASDRTRYAALLNAVCAHAEERWETGAPPLYVRYEGDLSALLRCLYCALPRWTRRRLRVGEDIIFTTDDVSGRERRLIASTGANNLRGKWPARMERGGYLTYAATTLRPEEFAGFFDALDRKAKSLGDADASSEEIRQLVWKRYWDASSKRFTDAPHLDGLSERELSRLLSDITVSGAYSETLRKLIADARRRAGTLTQALQDDLSKWEEGYQRYSLELEERTGEHQRKMEALEKRLSEQKTQYEKRVADLTARLSEEKAEREKLLAREDAQFKMHEIWLASQKKEYDKQLASQKADYEKKLSAQKTDYERQLSSQKAEYEKKLSTQKARISDLTAQLSEQKADYEKRLRELNRQPTTQKPTQKPVEPQKSKPVVQRTPQATPAAFTFETLTEALTFATLPERFPSVPPAQFLELTSRLFRKRHNFTPDAVRKYTRQLYAEINRISGNSLSPDYSLWLYMSALSEDDETLSAVRNLYESLDVFAPNRILNYYSSLVRECKSVMEIRKTAYELVKEECFRNDAKRSVPLDLWILLGREGVQLHELTNCFAIFEAKPNLSVLFIKPAEAVRQSEMFKRTDVQTYAAAYVKSKSSDERIRNVVRQWLSETYKRR